MVNGSCHGDCLCRLFQHFKRHKSASRVLVRQFPAWILSFEAVTAMSACKVPICGHDLLDTICSCAIMFLATLLSPDADIFPRRLQVKNFILILRYAGFLRQNPTSFSSFSHYPPLLVEVD